VKRNAVINLVEEDDAFGDEDEKP